jgi:hypothetical protein
MSNRDTDIQYGCNSQSHKPRKYTVLNGSFVFDLGDIFQEHKPL